MKNVLTNNHGVALILVIVIISLITAITIQLNISSRSGVYEAANLRDEIKLLYIAKSGFFIGEALLMEDDDSVDTLGEDWAQSDIISEKSENLFADGHFRLHIEDESGKIPINNVAGNNEDTSDVGEVLIRFLRSAEFNLSEQEVRDIVDAIKDWLDEDDEVTGFSAENAYYQGLEAPYPCKNGPMDSIDELLLVRGITKELFYGTEKAPGIGNYLTVYGAGKININTAPELILTVLAPEITEEMAAHMVDFRATEDNDLSNPSWYKDITGMSTISIEPDLITTKSTVFKITSTGYMDTMSKKVVGTVDRKGNGSTGEILSWKVD